MSKLVYPLPPFCTIEDETVILYSQTEEIIIEKEQFPNLKYLTIPTKIVKLILNLPRLEFLEIESNTLESTEHCFINVLVTKNLNLNCSDTIFVSN